MASPIRWGVVSVLAFSAALSASAAFASSDYLSVKESPYGARGDGVSDDTAAIQMAIQDAVARNLGTVFFPPGTYLCAGSLTIPEGAQGVTLLGAGNATSGLGLSSLLKFTGGGSGSLLVAGKTSGVTLRNLAIGYTSPAFTGTVVDFDSEIPYADTSFVVVEGCFVGGLGGSTGAAILISFNHSARVGIYRSNITGAVVGVRGARSSSDYANVVRIVDSRFGNLKTAIKNASQNWLISGNGFVATPSGVAGGYDQDPGMCANGVTFVGNWFGDVISGGTWIRYCGNNLTLVGNYLFGNGSSTGVQIVGSSNLGISIQGNQFGNHAVGIDLGIGQTGVSIQGNNFAALTIPVRGLSDHSETMATGNNGAASLINMTGNILTSGAVRAGSVTASGGIVASSVVTPGRVVGGLVATAVPGVGSVIGNGAGSDLFNQIRPNMGRNGWLTFTEDAVADRWIQGIRSGDPNLYFATGNPTSYSPRVIFGSSGIGIGGVVPQVSLDTAGAIAARAAPVILRLGVTSDIPAGNRSVLRVFSPEQSCAIGGFSGGTDGQILMVYSSGGARMTIRHEDSASADVNRIRTPGGSDVSAAAATFLYDAPQSRWVLMSSN